MKSHLILQMANILAQSTPIRPPHFCNWHIPFALIQLFTLSKGQILQQSFSNFLLHVDLFQYLIREEMTLNFIKKEATIVMLMMLKGHHSLYNSKMEPITELKAGSYHLVYISKGNYTVKLHCGMHELLIFTLRPEWFMREVKKFDEFKTLIAHYNTKASGVFALPYCQLNKNTTKPLRKIFSRQTKNTNVFDMAIITFLTKLIPHYQQKLAHRNYTTPAVHEVKANAISAFVQENFKDKTVEDMPGLARHFGISEKSLHRLAKVAFSIPMRKYVITLRMNYAMQQLIATDKPIQEIALYIGYNDPKYFSRAFKKYYKCNPSSIRRPSI